MMKKSYEIRLENARKREQEKQRVETLMNENPKAYLDQLYAERRDIYEKLDKI